MSTFWHYIDDLMEYGMAYLVHWFGFSTAVRVKDSMDFFAGAVFFGIVTLLLGAYAAINVERDKDLGTGVGIIKTEAFGKVSYRANPRTISEGIDVFLGFYILKFFPFKKLYYKSLRGLSILFYIIAGIILFFGLVTANWVTPESYEKRYHHRGPIDSELKDVSSLTSLDDPLVRYPVHFQLSTFSTGPRLSNKE